MKSRPTKGNRSLTVGIVDLEEGTVGLPGEKYCRPTMEKVLLAYLREGWPAYRLENREI
jgi:hypothetical protein